MFQDSDEDQNIVIFGKTGAGKSSLINLLLRRDAAPASNDALGCTTRNEDYRLPIDGMTYKLWDTPGLNEGSEGQVPAKTALRNLKSFVKPLIRRRNPPLFILCIHGLQNVTAQLRHYDSIRSTIGPAPFSIIVTGMDEYRPKPWSNWWDEHAVDLQSFEVASVDHAFVCTLLDDEKSAVSRQEVVSLIKRATASASSNYTPTRLHGSDIDDEDDHNHGQLPHRETDPFVQGIGHPYNPDLRQISRTPSPTPSETLALNQKGFFDWKSMFDNNTMWTKRRISAPSSPRNFQR